jgi:hypothetical protein
VVYRAPIGEAAGSDHQRTAVRHDCVYGGAAGLDDQGDAVADDYAADGAVDVEFAAAVECQAGRAATGKQYLLAAAVYDCIAGGASAIDHLRSHEDGGAAGRTEDILLAATDLRTEVGAAASDGFQAAGVDRGRIDEAAGRDQQRAAAADNCTASPDISHK